MPSQENRDIQSEVDKEPARQPTAWSLDTARGVDGKSVNDAQKTNRNFCSSMTDIPTWGSDSKSGSSSGFCLTDGGQVVASKTVLQSDQLIAKGLEQTHIVDMRDDARPSGSDIIDVAVNLGQNHADRWHDTPDGPGKCNLYADAVLRTAGVKLPWSEGHVPTVHQMRELLKNHPEDWERVFADGHGKKFDDFKSKPADFSLWDKTITPLPNDPIYHNYYH